MRVVINAVSAVTGGGATYLRQMARWLPRLAPESHFLFVVPPGIDLPPLLGNASRRDVPDAAGGQWRRWIWENTSLFDLIREWGGDLLFCAANIAPLRAAPVPLVIMLQSVAPFYPRVRRLVARFEGRWPAFRLLLLETLTLHAARRARLVLVLSKHSKALLERRLGPLSIRIAPHGIAEEMMPGVPRPAGAPAGPYLLFVSNFYVYKGLDLLVEALTHRPRIPPVVAVGRPLDKRFFAHLQRRIEEIGGSDRLLFREHVAFDELAGWYGNATAMVFPSWCESFGLTPLEAMACGCPVVGLNPGPLVEIASTDAWYCRPHDAAGLAAQLEQATQFGTEPRIRDRARQRALAFSWEGSMRLHLKAFHDCLFPLIEDSPEFKRMLSQEQVYPEKLFPLLY